MLLLNFKTNRIIYSQLQVVEVGKLFLSEAKFNMLYTYIINKIKPR